MKEINIGIIGFGVVGSGTAKVLINNLEEIEKKIDAKIRIKKIADLDIETDRGIKIEKGVLTRDVNEVICNPEIDIVVETIGGIEPAKTFILKAFDNGKHVITANKKLLAEEGEDIFQKSDEKDLLILFEASVGGAIPIIRSIKTSFASEKITEVRGILNGTSNYILTELSKGEMSFNEALKQAQAKGYAEADPSFDIQGVDASHKIAILSRILFGVDFNFKDFYTEGIEGLKQEDFLLAKKLGFEIKLLGITKMKGKKVRASVYPALVEQDSDLAKISGVTNAVTFYGEHFGKITLSGPGAGSLPTGTAIVSDIIAAARYISSEEKRYPTRNFLPQYFKKAELDNPSNRVGEYYIRFSFPDVAGVISRVSAILAKRDISIASIIQLEVSEYGKIAKAAMVLHSCKEANFLEAKKEIDKLDFMKQKSQFIRIER